MNISLWDTKTGLRVREISTGLPCTALAFSPDGEMLAAGQRQVRLYSVKTGREIRRFSEIRQDENTIAFFPGGKQLVVADSENEVRVWNIADGKPVRKLTLWDKPPKILPNGIALETIAAFGLSADGTTAAWLVLLWTEEKFGTESVRSFDRAVWRVRDVQTGRLIGEIANAPDRNLPVPVALHSRHIVGGGGYLGMWDVKKGERVWTQKFSSSELINLVISPDGKTFAAGYDDSTIQLWDTSTKQLRGVWSLRGGESSFHRLKRLYFAYSADSRSLLVACLSCLKRIDVTTGKMMPVVKGHGSEVITLGFSSNGQTLVSISSHDVLQWNMRTGSLDTKDPLIVRQSNKEGFIPTWPPGHICVVRTRDRLLRVMDANSNKTWCEVNDGPASVAYAHFSPTAGTLLLLRTYGTSESSLLGLFGDNNSGSRSVAATLHDAAHRIIARSHPGTRSWTFRGALPVWKTARMGQSRGRCRPS
jgi:WD40 repeat protein